MIKQGKILLVILYMFGLYGQSDYISQSDAKAYIHDTMVSLTNLENHEEVIKKELLSLIKHTQVNLITMYAKYKHWYSFTPYYLKKDLFDGAIAFSVSFIEAKITLYAHEEVVSLYSDNSAYSDLTNNAIKNVRNELLAAMTKEENVDFNVLFSQFLGMSLRIKMIDALIEEIKRISPQDGKPIAYQSLECPICMDAFDETVIRIVLLPCHHYICKSCLDRWKQTQAKYGAQLICPTCRGIVSNYPDNNVDFKAASLLF